jgi:hypothetical protein
MEFECDHCGKKTTFYACGMRYANGKFFCSPACEQAFDGWNIANPVSGKPSQTQKQDKTRQQQDETEK